MASLTSHTLYRGRKGLVTLQPLIYCPGTQLSVWYSLIPRPHGMPRNEDKLDVDMRETHCITM